MKFGRKLGANIKKFGKKLGKNANVIARKALHTIERVADDPFLQAASDLYAPGSSQGLKNIADSAHDANRERGAIVRFANSGHTRDDSEKLKNQLLVQ
jgi:hypothetical protein